MQPMPNAAVKPLPESLPEREEDIRAFLESLHCLRVRVQALRERETFFLHLADSAAYREGAPGNRANENASMAKEHARALRCQADDLMVSEQAAECWIASLPNSRHRDVLTLHYLNGWRYDRIAKAMGLSAGRTYTLQREAVKLLAQCRTNSPEDSGAR